MARSSVLYGPSGSWKTAQIKWFAHYIAEVTGRATYLLSTDGGGWAPCEPEVRAGMIVPYRIEVGTLPLSLLRNLSRGLWPVDTQETRPDHINFVPIDWGKVGGLAVEGWSSISQVIMRYLPDAGINVGGEDRAKLGGFDQEMYVGGALQRSSFRSSTRGDYGFVQNFLYGLVMNFNALPCHHVVYTALESRTVDEDRAAVYGPEIAGKKATASCGAWVGDLIHAQDYATPRVVKVPDPARPGEMADTVVRDMTVRYYYKTHLDASGVPFPAKPRVTPERIAELEKRFPGGYFEPGRDGRNGFGDYLREIDRLGDEQSDALKAWRERADRKLGRKPPDEESGRASGAAT